MRDAGSRPPIDLDAIEAEALAAWQEAGDDAGAREGHDAEDSPLPGGVDLGFAERVMAAELSVLDLPGALIAIDAEPEPAAAAPRVRGWGRGWGLGLAAAVLVGSAGAWATLGPTTGVPEASTPTTAATAVVDDAADTVRPAGLPIPANLDTQIAEYIAEYGHHFGPTFEFHGAILVARGGKIHYQRGFGVADPQTGAPDAPSTRMRIGMLTEQFTAAAILQLRDAGMLELSDPIDTHLPGFPNGRRVTIENLLDHTSGIPNYTNEPNFHRWKALPHRTEEMIGRFSELPLEFEPGTDFNPTNSGYYLLGAIIERCSGMSYGEYMQRYVFEPAGMTRTDFGNELDVARGNVWNEEEQLDPPDPIDPSVFGAAGGLVSTVEDFARWDSALYRGDVLSTASVDQMSDANRFGYGFGWLIAEAYGQRVTSFPGAIDGFNSSVMRFLEDQTLVVVLANTEVVPAGRVAQDIAMMIYGEQPAPRIEFPEVEVAPGTFTRYVGTYGITDETVRVLGDPLAEAQVEPLQSVTVKRIGERLYFDVPGHGSTWMHPMGRHRFFFKDNSGNYLTFATDRDGVATGLVVHIEDSELELARKGD